MCSTAGTDRSSMSAFILSFSLIFVAELGDKSQLATISLGSNQHSFIGVWLGSTAGMVVADGLAIAVGIVMGKHLPQKAIAYGAAALFVVFGLIAIGRAVSLAV